ncbi:MAG: surface lipoprotein assembly modifier [Rhodospirillales bacterium]|nr:surface lipoprotein assembly modifier [Rhodospirillales bacterium]
MATAPHLRRYYQGATTSCSARPSAYWFASRLRGCLRIRVRHHAPRRAGPTTDRTLSGQIKTSNRHVQLFGFTPGITVRQERRVSNLDLYDFTRNVAEVGVVRSF